MAVAKKPRRGRWGTGPERLENPFEFEALEPRILLSAVDPAAGLENDWHETGEEFGDLEEVGEFGIIGQDDGVEDEEFIYRVADRGAEEGTEESASETVEAGPEREQRRDC